MTYEESSLKLVVVFEDKSRSYAYGFEAGIVWAAMERGDRVIERSVPYRAENKLTFERMAAHAGYDIELEQEHAGGYVSLVFRKKINPRPFATIEGGKKA
jgi:hypothetical protein